MIDSFVTQCPQCRTSFRVSRAQLGAAHGAVRCGACLHVFNAAQQLLSEQPALVKAAPVVTPSPRPSSSASPQPAQPGATPAAAPSAANTAVQVTPAGKQPSETLWIHDDLDLDSLDLDEALAKLEEQEHQLSQEFLALERAPLPAERFLTTREPSKPYDDDWAEKLLNNDPPRRPVTPPPSAAASRNPSSPAPVAPLPAQPVAPAPATPEPAPTAAKPEPEAEAAAKIVEPTIAGTYAFLTDSSALELETPDDQSQDQHSTVLRAERNEPSFDDSDADDEQVQQQAPDADEEISDAQYRNARHEPQLRNEGLLNLAQEPLQLDWRKPKKTWGRKLAWLLINLLALAALGTQYVSYHFAELARQDQYRPWFAELCPNLGCKLPSKVEISLIKSSNLVVRSHPEFTGALVVDAILYNRAAFSQPFPLLELRFADLNGKLLASRSFKPSEYLAGELAGQAEMPPQTPIHISLDILDPGTKAVNYSLSFHSPE
ncbi:MAG: DUF3426 domain-containing protein [Pseudomonas sp.]|uniref:DUF3426 domain-containing protein n=1 Tax=Pseudomonas sp. TaxID=306 RepID=UPI003BB79CC5